jgi:hypothetical protein
MEFTGIKIPVKATKVNIKAMLNEDGKFLDAKPRF